MYKVSHNSCLISCFNLEKLIGQGSWDTLYIPGAYSGESREALREEPRDM